MAHRVVINDNNVAKVYVAADELYDKKKLDAIHSSVLTLLGHPACCSGFVITYTLATQEANVP